jgi:hypothetical protein
MTALQILNYTRLKNSISLTWLTREEISWSKISKKYYITLESEYHNIRIVCKCSKTLKPLLKIHSKTGYLKNKKK